MLLTFGILFQLDSAYIDENKTHGRRGKAYGSHISVPDNMDIFTCDRSNIESLRHYRVEEEVKVSSSNIQCF